MQALPPKVLLRLTCLFAGLIGLTGCGAATIRQQTSVDTAMGTIVSQTLYVQRGGGRTDTGNEAGEGSDAESAAIMGLLAELEEQELSWRAEGSEVARINARASVGADAPRTQEETGSADSACRRQDMGGEQTAIPVSSSLQEILDQIWQISADSDGALDVTLGRLSRLWNLDELAVSAGGDASQSTNVSPASGQEYRENEGNQTPIPTPAQIQSALQDTGYGRVRFSERAVALPAGMQLDLGAVGKGIACDRISAYLSSQPQVTGAVVAVGGSVVTYGQKPDGSPWKVAIMHPRDEGSYLGILSLKGEHYVSTSGDYERYVMAEGVRYHHILDPATGYPARSGLCSATIVCDSGLQADALSTACFVLGPGRGLALARAYGAEALLVEEDGTLHMTEGMKELFSPMQ